MTPGAVSGRCGLLGDCVLILLGTGSGRGGNHPGDYGLVTQSAVSGKRLTWRLWTCGPMYMTLGVTLDISDIKIQVQCLDGVSPWRMWPCYKDSGSGAG